MGKDTKGTKGDVTFRELMESIREAQRKSLRVLGLGLYSSTMVRRVETGERLPKKLERDRLLARLGVSGVEYEDYLSQDEYAEWVMRQDILKSIETKDVATLESKIAELEALDDEGKVERQFLETMRFMLLQMKHAPEEELRRVIELAVSYTIPDIDEGFPKKIALADQEINLLLEYVRLHQYGETEEVRRKWRLARYIDIVEYLRGNYLDDLGRAKVYPKAIYYIGLEYIDGQGTIEEFENCLELCTYAIECLRDAQRLYYLVEMLELRQWLIGRILEEDAGIPKNKAKNLRTLATTSKKWAALYKDLYTEYGIPPYMENFCFLYRETESHSSNEVIRLRRKMLGVTQEQFSTGVCTSKTVGRIENREISPQMYDLRGLFGKSAMYPEFVISRVISSDWEAIKLYNQVVRYGNDRNVRKWSDSLAKLENRLDMNILQNRQVVMRERIVMEELMQEISRQEAIERLIEVAKMSIPVDRLLTLDEWFLTREEITCIYNIAIRIGAHEDNKYLEILKEYCKREIGEEHISKRLGVHELLLTGMANYLGNLGEYEKSNAMADRAIRLTLENRRMYSLAGNLYNNCWNKYSVDGELPSARDNQEVDRTLRRCILLSDISHNVKSKDFFKKKLDN